MRGKLFGLLLAFAAILYWQDSRSDDVMDKYITDYQKFQHSADSVSKFADSLLTQIAMVDGEAKAAQNRAKVYEQRVVTLKSETSSLNDRAQELIETITDTLELARHILPLKDSIITTQETTIITQDRQIQELETVILKKDDALHLAILRGDSLQTAVNNIPPAPKNPNRMFGIKLPSRKTTFIVGVAAGVLIGGGVLR